MNNACPILIGSFTILERKLNQSRAINAYASTKCFRYMISVCKPPKAKVFHSPIDGVSKRMRE